MSPFVQKSFENNPQEEGDYIGEDGLLYCGKCNTPREALIPFSNLKGDGEKLEMKIRIRCQCRLEEQAQQEEADRERKRTERFESFQKRLRPYDLRTLDAELKDADLDHLEETQHNRYNLKLCRRVATACPEMMEKNQWLLLLGSCGTGKTLAAASIANYLNKQQVTNLVTSFPKMLGVMSSNFNADEEIINLISKVKLLVIDDLGAERSTDYAAEKVYSIVDARARAKPPTIFTTNHTMEELSNELLDMKYLRIYDRILGDCHPITFSGPSWRRQRAAKKYDEMKKFMEG